MDTTLAYYVQQKHIQSIMLDSTPEKYKDCKIGSDISFDKLYPKGWTRKVRTITRFSPEYLYIEFTENNYLAVGNGTAGSSDDVEFTHHLR